MAFLAPIDDSFEVTDQDELGDRGERQVSGREALHAPRSRDIRLFGSARDLRRGRGLVPLAVLAVVGLVWRCGGRSLEVREGDRRVLPTAERVAALGVPFSVDPDVGVARKFRSWGGGLKLTYEYDSTVAGQPDVRSIVWIDETEEEARETFRRTLLTPVSDWELGGEEEVGLVRLDEHDPIGDDSRIYGVVLGRRRLGHSITLRAGERTLDAKITGDLLGDDDARRLALGLLRDLRAFRP